MYFVLPLVVILSGAVVMILELAASRIIAPYLGSSVIVWTSLIGVILAALSVGNWIGGRIADRYPAPATLAALLLSASALIAISSQFRWLLSFVSSMQDLQSAAIMSVILMFGPATIALGTIAPFAVKLALVDIEKTGQIVGKLYAFSNAGSIAGTFLGGFILISLMGSTRILTLLSIVLAVLAVTVLIASRSWSLRWLWAGLPVLAVSLIPVSGSILLADGEALLADVDTRYSRTWIVEQKVENQTVRTLRNSVSGYQSGMVMEYPDMLLFEYTRMFDAFKIFKPDANTALMIGGSAYTYPRHYLAEDPSRLATVVEIDPGITELAKTYFGLADDPRLTIVYEDGRTYLNRASDTYDIVIIDAFNADNMIPFHLTTREAVERIADNLTEEGIVLINVISALTGSRSAFLAAEHATYREVFPYIKVYQVEPVDTSVTQNLTMVASRKPLTPVAHEEYAAELSKKEWLGEIGVLPVLTDDFAPVEWYAGAM